MFKKLTNPSTFVIFFASLASSLAIIYFYLTQQILLYNDARSHLDIARRVTDSLTPGIMQIGSVWLPLYHVLMLPFVQSEFLWRSGLAGAIVSSGAYIMAVFFLFKLLRLFTNSKIILAFGVVIFALNPNLLYLQSVPLDEMMAVSMAVISLYYIFSWSKTKYVPHFIIAAFFAFLGSLVRYELWFLVFAQIIFVLVTSLEDTALGNKLKKSEGYVITFATLALFGISLWLLYNFLGWGDPLYFLHHPGGHIDQQKHFNALGLLTTQHNLLLSIQVLLSNILENIGPALLLVSGLSLVFLLLKRSPIKNKIYYLTSLAPLGFLLLSLYLGITVLFTKIFPQPFTGQVFNVRYGIIALVPAVIISCAAFSSLKNVWKLKWIVYLFMLGIVVTDVVYFTKTYPVAAIDDGMYGISSFGQVDESKISSAVSQHCSTGLTLISANQNEIIMFESGFPMNSFIYEGSGKYWKKALSNPSSIASCILISKDGPIWDQVVQHPNKLDTYTPVYTSISGDTVLYKKGVKKPVVIKKQIQETPKPITESCSYTVKTGDSLWKISRRITGEGKNMNTIVSLNTSVITNPSIIHPQDNLIVPCLTDQLSTNLTNNTI